MWWVILIRIGIAVVFIRPVWTDGDWVIDADWNAPLNAASSNNIFLPHRLPTVTAPVDFELPYDLYGTEQVSFREFRPLSTFESGNYSTFFTKVKSIRRVVEKGRWIVWFGTSLERNACMDCFALLMLFVDDDGTSSLHGTVSTPSTVYAIVSLPDNSIVLRATNVSDFPDDSLPVNNKTYTTVASFVAISSSMAVLTDALSAKPYPIISSDESIGSASSILTHSDDTSQRRSLFRRIDQRRLQNSTLFLDILIIVTNLAMCEYAGLKDGCDPTESNKLPILQKISLLQEEFNFAISSVGIVNVQLRVVGVRILPSALLEIYASTETLNYLRSDVTIQGWRNETSADMVLLLTGLDPVSFACGRAVQGGSAAVVAVQCLETYSFTHEVGHMLSASHDRDNTPLRHPYGHGYRLPGYFRTVMAFSCTDTPPCNRIPFFSTPLYKYLGFPMGTIANDNARLIGEMAPNVSVFVTVAPSSAPSLNLVCPVSTRCPSSNLVNANILFVCFSFCVGNTWARFLTRRMQRGCGDC
jgi:Metallo-peptidase family M12